MIIKGLNWNIIKNKYPILVIKGLLDELGRVKVLSKIDLKLVIGKYGYM